jgi:hypothetical protein
VRYTLENLPVFLRERRHQWRWDPTHQTIFSLPVCLAPIYLAAPLSFRFSNAFVSISQQGRKMLLIAFLYLCATTVSATCFHPDGTIPGCWLPAVQQHCSIQHVLCLESNVWCRPVLINWVVLQPYWELLLERILHGSDVDIWSLFPALSIWT